MLMKAEEESSDLQLLLCLPLRYNFSLLVATT